MAEETIIEKTSKKLLKYLNYEKLPVKKLVLFGSYALGKQGKDSDIDYIVISPFFRDMNYLERINKTMYIDSKMVKEFLLPFDILYYSDTEWEQSTAIPINEAKKYGIIIFSEN